MVPNNISFNSAKICLYYYGTHNGSASGRTYDLHRVTNNWQQLNSSWEHRELNGANQKIYWDSYLSLIPSYKPGGGDYDSNIEASAVVPNEIGNWMTWDITNLALYWIQNPNDNFGVIIKDSEEIETYPGDNWKSHLSQFRSNKYAIKEFKPYLELGFSGGIGSAKKFPIGTRINLTNKIVSADFTDKWDVVYVSEGNRSNAIGIKLNYLEYGLMPGDVIDVSGELILEDSAELMIDATQITVKTPVSAIKPIGLTNKSCGGGAFGSQPAVYNSDGINTVGHFIRTTGQITGTNSVFELQDGSTISVFWIDDGSSLIDGFHYENRNNAKGIAVILPDGQQFPTGYVNITGIVRAIQGPNGIVPIIAAVEIN